jgi:hypothetical protein
MISQQAIFEQQTLPPGCHIHDAQANSRRHVNGIVGTTIDEKNPVTILRSRPKPWKRRDSRRNNQTLKPLSIIPKE